MATYFHGNSEILGGGDGLQTLIFMNPPSYVGFSDTHRQLPHPAAANSCNFVFLNADAACRNSPTFPDAPSSQTPHFHPQSFLPRLPSNLYSQQPVELDEARERQHGLSLSLSSQQPPPALNADPSNASDGLNSVQKVLSSSKYLKGAQDLLDEVANIGKGLTITKKGSETDKLNGEQPAGGEIAAKRAPELTTVEKQEIKVKKGKLISMLDEVEQRYRQYNRQMKTVITWFEQAAGIGSAKAYTAVALQTISKQFRCLKDSILAQIKAASRSLGEEDEVGEKTEGSRLKYVDNRIRQQRALQQLGMIQPNAWRPQSQRGLPERSVSVLRSWLFEHFLHPYPKDSDKIMLAKQTGLTRSQVSNWFINARVRLWKPMIEDMYTQEVKEHDPSVASKSKHVKSNSKSVHPQPNSLESEKIITSDSTLSKHQNTPNIALPIPNIGNHPMLGLSRASEPRSATDQGSPKKPRNVDMFHSPSTFASMNVEQENNDTDTNVMMMRFGSEQQMGMPTNLAGGFGPYQYPAPSFSGSGVSLTLGLQHRESFTMSGAFMPVQIERRIEEVGEGNELSGINIPTPAHSTGVYHHISFQNQSRFTSQMLQTL